MKFFTDYRTAVKRINGMCCHLVAIRFVLPGEKRSSEVERGFHANSTSRYNVVERFWPSC